jgi:16S rRNA (uracil1498-N3)-methyltransferase
MLPRRRRLTPDPAQANYLGNVLRLKTSDSVLVFNGRDGEWRGALARSGKRTVTIDIAERTRSQTRALDLHYLFAPLCMPASITWCRRPSRWGVPPAAGDHRHAQVARINLDRMRANAIEAAEQCGILTLRRSAHR